MNFKSQTMTSWAFLGFLLILFCIFLFAFTSIENGYMGERLIADAIGPLKEVPLSQIDAAGKPAPLDWLAPIDAQLRLMRERDIERAYQETTSKDFQASTPLQTFKEFVERNPILQTHTDILVKSHSIHGDDAAVSIMLNPDSDAILLRYFLVHEDGTWKIWNINIASKYAPSVEQLLKNPISMQQPISGQLQALRNEEVTSAYYNFTSKSFQEKTSFTEFRQFLTNFPVLAKHDAVSFKDPILHEGTGRIEVNLHELNDGTTTLLYLLGIEDDQWKIFGLEVIKQVGKGTSLPTKKEAVIKPENLPEELARKDHTLEMEFVQVQIGTKLDAEGNIISPTTVLQAPEGDIYVTLFIQNGTAGTKVDVSLEHVESHSLIPPLSTTLEQDGNTVVSFSFSPPISGWPKGHYLLIATSSTSVNKLFTFDIE